jgi:hypothetical protein
MNTTSGLDVPSEVAACRARLEDILRDLEHDRDAFAQSGERREARLRAWEEAGSRLADARCYCLRRVLPLAAINLAWGAAWLDVAHEGGRIAAHADGRLAAMRREVPASLRSAMPRRCLDPGGHASDPHRHDDVEATPASAPAQGGR